MTHMDAIFKIYIAGWSMACLIAAIAVVRHPTHFSLLSRAYWHFLTEPWKVLTFVAGAALITLVAPYTGDPTWDYVDGLFMSVLCYTTAPWVVAVWFFASQSNTSLLQLYVSICLWLFSASWSYDIYLVWRDGDYPITWLPNLFASSLIYLCAGLFWNLEWRPERGVIFSFMRKPWPVRAEFSAPLRLALYAIVLAIPTISAVAMFLI